MIQGIQNVSFSGAKSKVANKALQKAEELYVSASSNLAGTVNAKRAERLSRDAVISKIKILLLEELPQCVIQNGQLRLQLQKLMKKLSRKTVLTLYVNLIIF